MTKDELTKPLDWIPGLKQNWKYDLLSGFTVFLIALPLCLGIAMASGVPPMSGIIAGVVGGLLLSMIGGGHLTVNGPAAGLAIMVLSTIEGFKLLAPAGLNDSEITFFAYRCTLAVGVGCGVLQLLFSVLKAGKLSSFFPPSVVHGMMSAIGIMIIIKQFHSAIGVKARGSSLFDVMADIPRAISELNSDITIISIVSLTILIVLPRIKNKFVRMLPAPLIVVLVAIPLGHYFSLKKEHAHEIFKLINDELGRNYLVTLPENLMDGFVFPDFSLFFSSFSIQMIIAYSLVASLESLLTSSAIEKLDPYKRVTNYNAELFGKGFGNILSSFLGGLPIIAEVVRSSSNVANGARTRWSNFFHGLFLLCFIVFLPGLIQQIPLAALASILIFTGFRLSSPLEYIKTYKLGKEQFLIYVMTIIVTLVTDLLMGITFGIVIKLFVQFLNGVPLGQFFVCKFDEEKGENGNIKIILHGSLVFSNFMRLKRKLEGLPLKKNIIIDLSETVFIDHSIMSHLSDFSHSYIKQSGMFELVGLDKHYAFSDHPNATLKRMMHRFDSKKFHQNVSH